MNADLRASLLVGAVAAGLSLLVGIFARIPFVPLLLRAVVFAVLFGGLAWGAAILLHTYVPDLFDGAGKEGEEGASAMGLEEGADERLGNSVDIVLDDRDEDDLSVANPGVGALAGLTPGKAKAAIGDDEVLDVAPMADSPGDSAAEPPIIELADDGEEAEETSGASVSARPAAGMDDLDVLPDLDALAGSYGNFDLPSARSTETFAPSTTASGDDSRAGSSTSGPGGSDPATLAAAVRTMLKRDQKG